MTVSSTGNTSLEAITSSYVSYESENQETEDALGRDAFLTMLVAQLQNQDPLNPEEGTDFSSQLAQFSQLEQLMNLNDTLEDLAASLENGSEDNALDYIGKQVTGNADTMTVDQGSVSGGFYNLSEPSEVMVSITDANGVLVKTLYPGQQEAGSHVLSWDGTDSAGNAVEDGTYTYTVMANTGSGYFQVPTSVSGTVDGVAYNNDKAYLVVQGILLDPDSLTSVTDMDAASDTGSVDSVLEYLGRSVTTTAPIILMDDGEISGSELSFELENQSDVTVRIYDAYDGLVRSIDLTADETRGGENTVSWDGLTDDGYQAADGMYYYTVQSDDGYASTPVSGEVTGIKNVNSSQYLVMGESGFLVALSNVTDIY